MEAIIPLINRENLRSVLCELRREFGFRREMCFRAATGSRISSMIRLQLLRGYAIHANAGGVSQPKQGSQHRSLCCFYLFVCLFIALVVCYCFCVYSLGIGSVCPQIVLNYRGYLCGLIVSCNIKLRIYLVFCSSQWRIKASVDYDFRFQVNQSGLKVTNCSRGGISSRQRCFHSEISEILEKLNDRFCIEMANWIFFFFPFLFKILPSQFP